MKIYLSLLAIFLGIFQWNQSFAQTICHSVYRPNIGKAHSNNMEILAQLNRVDNSLSFLNRQVRKSEVHTSYYQQKVVRDFEKVEKALLNNDVNAARIKIGSLYTKVQTSYLKVLQHSKLTKALREAHQIGLIDVKPFLKEKEVVDYLIDLYGSRINNLDDIARVLREVEEDIIKDIRVLGKNFQRYEYYSEPLKKLKGAGYCSAACKDSIKLLEKELSVLKGAKANMVNDFIGMEKSITLNKVRSVYASHPETLLIQRKKELLFEGIGVLKRFVEKYSLLRKLTNYLADNLSPRFRGLFRMLRSVFDERYLLKHSKGIERIINSELSATQKYQLMKSEVRDIDEKLFWVDLSRTPSNKAKKAWEEIKDVAKNKNQAELNQMLDAQKVGEVLGSPRNRNIRNTIRIVSTLALVGGSVAYFSFETDDDDNGDDQDFNQVDTQNGNSIDDLNNGNSIDLDNGEDQVNDIDNDSTTVLIDYLSPEDREIEDLMIDLLEVNADIEAEKDSP